MSCEQKRRAKSCLLIEGNALGTNKKKRMMKMVNTGLASYFKPHESHTRVTFSRLTIPSGVEGGKTIYRGHVRGGGKRSRSTAPLTRSSGLKRRRSRPRRVVSIARLRQASPAPARRTSRSLVFSIPRRNCKSPSLSFARFTLDHRLRGCRLSAGRCRLRNAGCGVFHNGALSSIVDTSTLASLSSSFFLDFLLLRSDRLQSDR